MIKEARVINEVQLIKDAQVSVNHIINNWEMIYDLTGKDINKTLRYLNVEEKDFEVAKIKLQKLFDRDEETINSLQNEIDMVDAQNATISGGVTKYEMLFWGPFAYQDRLYMSHELLGKYLTVNEILAALTAIIPISGPIVALLQMISIAAVKLTDKGNGVILTRTPAIFGVPIAISQ